MIYLDNAATGFPKPKCVINEVNRLIKGYCANPGRSSHKMAQKCAERVFETRERIASLFSLDSPSSVVFCSNATDALNTAIKGLITERCHVITSDVEHNSVLRPLYKLRDTLGLEISYYNSDNDPEKEILKLKRHDTKYIVTTLRSNVTGKTVDVATLTRVAHGIGCMVIADGTQLAGHEPINIRQLGIDCFCTAGHKGLLALQGSGLLLLNIDQRLQTLKEGGTGFNTFSEEMPDGMPERYEAGTLNLPAIISLHASIGYLSDLGLNNVKDIFERQSERLKQILTDNKKVTLYGCESGIAAFNLESKSCYEVAEALDREGVCVRAGFHCAPTIHKKLGTEKIGSVRVSTGIFNSSRDIDILYKTLKKI